MICSKEILTIGCSFSPPKGGIAFVLDVYKRKVYSNFRFVANSSTGSLLMKIWILLRSYIKCEWLEHTDKDIRIVHIHTASYNSFKRSTLYIKQAKRNGKKVVLHIHGGGFKEYRNSCTSFVDKHLSMCDAIVALSDSWKDYFANELGYKNVYVVNNIIDYPLVMETAKDNKFHLLFLGLISEAKGIFDLLEVLKEKQDEWRERVVLHVGGNGKVSEFRQMVANYGIEDMVVYEGWVSGKKKAYLLSLSDAFILPSYTEGMPISILEAMSYGLPILSTPVGGIPELIKNGENGILFKPGELVGITNSINTFINDYDLGSKMGELAKECSKRFIPESISTQLEYMYNSI